MAVVREYLAGRFGDATLTVLGVILLVLPLALWVAWSKLVFVTVLTVGAIALGLICLITSLEDTNAGHARRAERTKPLIVVTDKFFEELHRLYPLTYHHRKTGSRKFRKAMKRLLSFVETTDRRPD
jgi:hypothetical protein